MSVKKVFIYNNPRLVYSLDDPKFLDRFWSKVDKTDSRRCWNWTAHKTPWGYGDFTFNRRVILAHRLSMMIHLNRELLSKECVLHSCDNRLCVNPEHLFLGTKKQNTEDAKRKGRLKGRRSRIPKEVREEIYRLRIKDPKKNTLKVLTEKFGLSIPGVVGIVEAIKKEKENAIS